MVSNIQSGASWNTLSEQGAHTGSLPHTSLHKQCPLRCGGERAVGLLGSKRNRKAKGLNNHMLKIIFSLSLIIKTTVLWRRLWRIRAELAGFRERSRDNAWWSWQEHMFVWGNMGCEGYDQERHCWGENPKAVFPWLSWPKVTAPQDNDFLTKSNKI